ncbi:hypothetical protein FHR71_005349 [Methylobacterium sp. RAS18]|nr:hypothetical protein [Methylobacterium sp. RAS18]
MLADYPTAAGLAHARLNDGCHPSSDPSSLSPLITLARSRIGEWVLLARNSLGVSGRGQSPHRREYPLPHFVHAVVIADAGRSGLQLMKAQGTGFDGLIGDLFCKPPLKRAGVVVELGSHVAELRYDRGILVSQRICQFAAEPSLRSKICCEELHVA